MIVRRNIVKHMETSNVFNNGQHGFRSGRSCLTQLLQHYDNLIELLCEKQYVDVIYLDFAKAFDKVDHKILFKKLEAVGIMGELLAWIRSFLLPRSIPACASKWMRF